MNIHTHKYVEACFCVQRLQAAIDKSALMHVMYTHSHTYLPTSFWKRPDCGRSTWQAPFRCTPASYFLFPLSAVLYKTICERSSEIFPTPYAENCDCVKLTDYRNISSAFTSADIIHRALLVFAFRYLIWLSSLYSTAWSRLATMKAWPPGN